MGQYITLHAYAETVDDLISGVHEVIWRLHGRSKDVPLESCAVIFRTWGDAEHMNVEVIHNEGTDMANKKTTAYTGTGVSSQKGGNKPGAGGHGEHGKARGEAKMPSTAKTTPAPTRKR